MVLNYVDGMRQAVTGFGTFAIRGILTAQTSWSLRVHEGIVLLMYSGALREFVFPWSIYANLPIRDEVISKVAFGSRWVCGVCQLQRCRRG